MRIITFSKCVQIKMRTGDYTTTISPNPGERLIFDDFNAHSIEVDPTSNGFIDSITHLSPLIEEIARPSHFRNRRVLFYRNRGIGDQLILSAASRFFVEMLGAQPFQASDPVHQHLWLGNPFIGGAPLMMPIHLDVVWRARGPAFVAYSWFFESISEWDSDSEQGNVYDRLFDMLGFDHDRVAAKFKRPTWILQKTDLLARGKWLEALDSAKNISTKNGYIFFAPNTTNKVRSLPLPVIELVLNVLDQYVGESKMPVLVADDKPFSVEIQNLIAKSESAVDVSGAITQLRLFAALIGSASVVIAPDSSALHIAAAFETPAIGLWGAFSPQSRILYYPRQIHLFHPDRCSHAPCFNYLPELPISKCPQGPAQQHCEVFDGISAEEILDALANLQ